MVKKVVEGSIRAGLVVTAGITTAVSAQTVAAQTGLTEEQVIEIALLEVDGEVQEVEREQEDGIQIYEIEILASDGSEIEVEINAETGEVLEVEADGENDDHDCDKEQDA